MRRNVLAIALICVAARIGVAAEEKAEKPQADAQMALQIGKLVGRLNDDRAAERDDAEKKLLELAGTSTTQSDRFLQALPQDTDQMPLAVRDRLSRIRQQVE